MRRIERKPVPPRVENYLTRKQEQVDGGAEVDRLWSQARQTRTMAVHLFNVLLEMAGKRERCMYCGDSRGTDIEHFWPKAPFPHRAFQWANMLLACSGCNRKKGDRFPLDEHGEPLLIDPSCDEPWEFLDFIPETGELAPRWRADLDGFDPRGEATLDPGTLPLNIEAVALGRQRAYRRLQEAVRSFLRAADGGAELDAAFRALSSEIADSSGYGLMRWLLLFSDGLANPFAQMRARYPEHWDGLRWTVAR